MQTHHANVIAKPPTIFLGFLALGVIMGNLAELPIFSPLSTWPVYVGVLMIIDGLAMVWLARRQMKLADTPMDVRRSVNHIVTRGIFRFSRNPIYLGMIASYLGLALILNNLWLVIGLIILIPIMTMGVIAREERYLEQRFQDEFREYRNRVRRWL